MGNRNFVFQRKSAETVMGFDASEHISTGMYEDHGRQRTDLVRRPMKTRRYLDALVATQDREVLHSPDCGAWIEIPFSAKF